MSNRAGIALTFDDGPDARGTPAVLRALAAVGATATFFVVAPRAEAHPELVAEIAAGGHRIGLHCDEHVRHSERDRRWGARDVGSAIARLERCGVRPTLWRTPWGDVADWTAGVAADHALTLVGWTADTHDWRGDSAERMLEGTCEQLNAGAIVLAHDGLGPGARRDDVIQTVRYVGLVAGLAHERRLELASLP